MEKSFASDAIYNTTGNIAYFFCLWIITVLVVRMSGYEAAGILSLAMTTSNVFFVVANYGMRSFQASDIKRQYSNAQYVLSRYLTVVVGVVLCAFFAWFTGYKNVQYGAIMLYMVYKSLEAFADVLYGVLQRENMLKYSGISLILKGILSVIAFTMGLISTGNILWALVGMDLASLMVLVCYDVPKVKAAQTGALQVHKQDLGQSCQLLKCCFAMFVVSIAPMILQAIPKLMFEKIYTTEELGIYSSVAAPTVVLTTLVSCIMIPFLPLFAQYIQEKQRRNLAKLLIKFVGSVVTLGVIACAVAYLMGGWALSFLYGNNLREYRDLLVWVVCSVSLTNVLYCLNALFIAGRKLPILAAVYIVADIFCYLVSGKCIAIHGIYGITDALNLTQLVQCGMLTALSVSFFRKKN